jgi:hypothetical protein
MTMIQIAVRELALAGLGEKFDDESEFLRNRFIGVQ